MDKDSNGYSPHMNVEGSDGYNGGHPRSNASNVDSRGDMYGDTLHQPHRIEKLLENPAEIGILTKLKDNEEARSDAVKEVYEETKASLGAICPKDLPNDLSEREKQINTFKEKAMEERKTVKEKETGIQKDMKELLKKYSSIEQETLDKANPGLLALKKESNQILEKIRELEIEKTRTQGSNYQVQLSQKTQDLSKSTDESCSKLQDRISTMIDRLNKILEENQSKFNQDVKPLLDQDPQKISDMPDPLSPVAAPKFAEFNSELKESFNKLLADVAIPDEKKEFNQRYDLKSPAEFPDELEENPDYNEIVLSEDGQSEEDSNKPHSLNSISDKEHDYKVSPLASTVKSSSEESKGSHSHSRRSGSSPPENKGSIPTPGVYPRSSSVEASDKNRDQNKEETKEGNEEEEQPAPLLEDGRNQNEYGTSGGEENEGGSLGNFGEGDSYLTDDCLYEGGSDDSENEDNSIKHTGFDSRGNPSSVSSYGQSHSQPTDQSHDGIHGSGFNNHEENKTEESGIIKLAHLSKTNTIISKIENLGKLVGDTIESISEPQTNVSEVKKILEKLVLNTLIPRNKDTPSDFIKNHKILNEERKIKQQDLKKSLEALETEKLIEYCKVFTQIGTRIQDLNKDQKAINTSFCSDATYKSIWKKHFKCNRKGITKEDIKYNIKVYTDKAIKENEARMNQYIVAINNRVEALYGIVNFHKDCAPKLSGFSKHKNSKVPKYIKSCIEKYQYEIDAIKAREKEIYCASDNPDHNKAAKILEEIERIFKMYFNGDSNDFSKLAEFAKEFDTEIINVCTIMQEQNNKITKLEEEFKKNSKELESQSLMKIWFNNEKKKCKTLEEELEELKSNDREIITNLEEQVESKEKVIVQLKQDNKKLHLDNKDMENNLKALEDAVKELNNQKMASEDSIETMQSELARMKEENEYLSTFQSENESLNSQLQDLKSQLSKSKTTEFYVSRITELNRKSNKAETEKNVIEYELKQAKQNIEKLTQEIKQMGDLKEENQAMKDQQEEFKKEVQEIEKENRELKGQARLLKNKQDVEEIGEVEGDAHSSLEANTEHTINDQSQKVKEYEQTIKDLQEKLKAFEDKEVTVERFTEQIEQIKALQNDLDASKTKLDDMETKLNTSLKTNDELKEKNRTLQESLDGMKNEEVGDFDIVDTEEEKEFETENVPEKIAAENEDDSVPEGPTSVITVHKTTSKSVNLQTLGSSLNEGSGKELNQKIKFEEIKEDYLDKLGKYEEKNKNYQEQIQKMEEEKAIKEEQLKEQLLKEQRLKEQHIQRLNKEIKDIEEKKQDIDNKQTEIKKLNDDIKELNQEKQTIQKDLEDQKTINTNTLNESKKEKDKSQKKIAKLSQRIAQLKDKLNKYSETLKNSSSSYLKYSKISKNLTERLSTQEQKYTDLKGKTRKVMDRLEKTKLKREEDIEAYSKLRVEYLKLKKSFNELLDKDETDTADFNNMRLCFEGFVRDIGEANNSLCEGFEYTISKNIKIANEFRSDTESKIESYNQEIDQRWKNNVTLNLQNVEFIGSLKYIIQETNEKSKNDIQNSSKDLLSLSEEVKEELNTLKDKYPLIEQGYEHFLLQNKEKLNKIKEDITTQEDLIHDTNTKIHNHNKDIRNEVQQEKDEIESYIDILKNKLSALQFIANQVDEKLNQSELLEYKIRERDSANTNKIIKEHEHKG